VSRVLRSLAVLVLSLAAFTTAYATGLQNIALGKSITPLTNTVLGDPAWVTDGDAIGAAWYSYQGGGYNTNSFTIDLGAQYAVDSVNIYIAQVYGYELYSSDNGTDWTLRSQVNFGISQAGPLAPLAGGYSARYFSYWAYATWNQYVGVVEFQVCTVDSTPNPNTCTLAPKYTVGGSATGLVSGDTLVLQNNGTDNLNITADGSFTFATALASGDAYAVTVGTNPTDKTCTVSQGTGTIGSANVTNVSVSCGPTNVALSKPASATSTYDIYVPSRGNDGDIATIWNGGSTMACWQVDLQAIFAIQTIIANSEQWGTSSFTTTFQVAGSVNGSIWSNIGPQTTGTSATPSFSFDASGAAMRYIRFCTVAGTTQWATLGELQAYGPLAATYTVGGNVSGLAAGDTLVLEDNGVDTLDITVNGPFTFGTPLNAGATYTVSVGTNPSGKSCAVSGGTGTIASANVTDISVSCQAIAPVVDAEPVPTLSEWALMLMMLLLALSGGGYALRREGRL
jgi:hypothetical protein